MILSAKLLLLVVVLLANHDVSKALPDIFLRLAKTIIPKKYELYITTNLEPQAYTFEGRVLIKVHVKENTDVVKIHFDEKKLNTTKEDIYIKRITNGNVSADIPITDVIFEREYQFIKIFCNKLLESDQHYIIHIPFVGALSEDNQNGFYRSPYYNTDTNCIRWLAITDMYPMYARTVFPCFDEPDMKAVYSIHLGRHETFKTVANTEKINTIPIKGRPGWVWDIYEDSHPMDTFQVGFTVLNYEHVLVHNAPYNLIIRIWADIDVIFLSNYAKSIIPKIIESHTQTFGVNLPLKKLDIISVANMDMDYTESWGITCVREILLLCGYGASDSKLEDSAAVLTRTLAHQWFGNYVSVKWWNDIWLKEAVGTFIAQITLGKLFPEWKTQDVESFFALGTVIEYDSRNYFGTVAKKIKDPKEVSDMFTNLTFKKGSLIIRMIYNTFGERIFFQSFKKLFLTHKYGVIDEYDLWKTMTELAHKAGSLPKYHSVDKIVDSWSRKSGYPVISVVRDYERNSAKISQKHFDSYLKTDCLDPNNKVIDTTEITWYIPITYTNGKKMNFGDVTTRKWLADKSTLEIKNIATKDDWVVFNINYTGIYRVKYDELNWRRLANLLNNDDYFRNISILNRASLLTDIMDFAWYGEANYRLAFNIYNYLPKETEFLPWNAALCRISKMNTLLLRTPIAIHMQNYVKRMIQNLNKKFTNIFTNEPDPLEYKLKIMVKTWACRIEMYECVEATVRLFREWKDSDEKKKSLILHEDFRYLVLCNGIKFGKQEDWDYLWARYKDSENFVERSSILLALTCSREVWILKRYLDILIPSNATFGETSVNIEHSMATFSAISENPVGFYAGKEFILEKADEYTITNNMATRLLFGNFGSVLIVNSNSMKEYQEIKDIIEKNRLFIQLNAQGVRSCLDASFSNVRWVEMNYKTIKEIITLS